ncbi:MAG TPA: alpha/beta hydrolase domain-containing protein [Acidimicrobiia bacterium]|jgi:hypothetical protein
MHKHSIATLLAGTLVIGVAACSSSSSKASSTTASAETSTAATNGTTATTVARPAGPAADMSKQLTGGKGVFIGDPVTVDLAKAGYTEHEYEATGTATSYKAVGALPGNGRWALTPASTAPYRTRVLVRMPASKARFSGNVIVEWLNVSGGIDADPEWSTLNEEIIRHGDAYVGVSTQELGIMGGPVLVKVNVPGASDAAGKGLVKIDPARYGNLTHPGDAYAMDIFTQVARAVRTGAGLGGRVPQRLIAAGESQSAFAMVSYYDGVQPLTKAFDGFFVHSRGAGGLPLLAGGPASAGIANAISGPATIFRTDVAAPVMDVQTETDVTSILNSYAARQPDNNGFRLWEVTGTSHADAHLLGANAKYVNCGVPINNGDLHIVAKAAYRALEQWMSAGTPPLHAPRIDVTPGKTPTIKRDADGIALGGIRTPPVDVPVSALSGVPGPNPSTICLLLGSSKPFAAARLAQLYPSKAVYMQKFTADVDATIKSGFALADDRAAMLGFAEPNQIK